MGLPDCRQSLFLFQLSVAATATTIVSGAIAGRVTLGAYLLFAAVLAGFLYPVVAHWVWSTGLAGPWLANRSGAGGYVDFAGSGVVHVVGGAAALAACAVAGPRPSRLRDPRFAPIRPHSNSYVGIGALLLVSGTLCA